MPNFHLKDIRQEHEMTQSEIAYKLNVKRGTYASWECGSDIIPTAKLFAFAEMFGVSVDYILWLAPKRKIKEKHILNPEEIGKNIKKIRYKNKLSQTEFAGKININQSTLWEYENDKTLITTATLIAIRKEFKYSVDYILNRKIKVPNA